MELNSCVCGMKIYFNLNSQGNEKPKVSPKRPTTFKVLEMKLLIIASYEDLNFYFSPVGCKVMAKKI